MEDTLQADSASDARLLALALGDLLREHKGADVVVLDLRGQSDWTDFFVIATVMSTAHVQGLLRHIKEFASERNIAVRGRSRKASPDEEWNLVDMGSIVAHLMTVKSRSFYELERLWNVR
jgi:ribosome-associated protein